MKDPVCGMDVDPATAKHHARHAGEDFHFCSAGCKTRFEANPDRYLSGEPQPMEPVPEGTIFTCPMHPEIRQEGPGSCPICGMALEPETVSLDDGPNAELVDFTRRFWIGLVLTLPVFVLEMGQHLFGLHLLPQQTSNYVQFALATPVVLWAGWPFFERGAASVRSGHLNMFTLIALGTGVAYLYSLAGTFAPGLFPPAFRMHGAVPVYFEAAAVITVLVLLGQLLELRARERTSGAIKALLGLAPATARRITPEGEADIPLDAVSVGDLLRVRPGEKVPWMASSPRAGARWTKALSRANPCPSPRRPATGSWPEALPRAAASSCARRRSAATRCSPASSRWWRRRSGPARPSSGWRTAWPAGSCRR